MSKWEILTKIRMLYQFCILTKNGREKDAREQNLRNMLATKTPIQADNFLHDILIGRITLNQALGKELV